MTLEHRDCEPMRLAVPPVPFVIDDVAEHVEANHRIANSLQLISALLSSQGREVTDPVARSALDMSVHRIDAVASVHRQLHRACATRAVDIATYLVDLVDGLQASFHEGAGRRRLHLDVEQLPVTPDFATTLGVIVTELVINACKYAYASDEPGDVDIAFAITVGNGFSLEVRDRGVGRSTRSAEVGATGNGLGSRIVDLMARRLRAEGGYLEPEVGTTFRIRGQLPVA
ncbi:sensor histidine kinase [Sphingomonas morindae]|uniref:histidine kinase n=1 Tax=Sphingomonas morindae TaxID=1541170 RepID=A0ABY4X7G4_9SPHN|nr:sensor histidine kinase [Sphingomonas morindae]USI72869.1 sensor histidine kinase [Sphingomonas morindae]